MHFRDLKRPVLSALAFFWTLAAFSFGYSAYVTNMPSTVSAGSWLSSSEWNKMVAALQALDTAISQTSQAEAWSAASTGGVPASAAWMSTIPWLSVTFNLKKAARVNLIGNGIQRTNGGAGTCHASYRFVVDGTGRWNATYGQRIVVSNNTYSWHAPFTIIWSETLAAWSHTIQLQAWDSAHVCHICAEADGTAQPYDGCDLNIEAFYQ